MDSQYYQHTGITVCVEGDTLRNSKKMHEDSTYSVRFWGRTESPLAVPEVFVEKYFLFAIFSRMREIHDKG